MKHLKYVYFLLFFTIGLLTILFTSCNDDDSTIEVTGINLDNTLLYYLVGEAPVISQTLVATITPTNATDTIITWTSSNEAIVIVDNTGTLSINTTTIGTATITAQIGNKTATCIITISDLQISGSVTINNVNWSTCNVDAPKTFTDRPTAYGMFYQWNSNVGWPSTGTIGSITATDGSTTWNDDWTGGYSSPSSSDTWTTANDPSPEGYRLPTYEEIEKLVDPENVITQWTTFNGVNGRKFTDKFSGNSIFIPASGCRLAGPEDPGMLNGASSDGHFWCSTAYTSVYAYAIDFGSISAWWPRKGTRATGLSIRSVAE